MRNGIFVLSDNESILIGFFVFSLVAAAVGTGPDKEGREEGEDNKGDDTLLPEQVREDRLREQRLFGRRIGEFYILYVCINRLDFGFRTRRTFRSTRLTSKWVPFR